MFTLAHELSHLWLGETGLSNVQVAADPASEPAKEVERWCNAVAAEFLVPLETFRVEVDVANLNDEILRLSKRFKVSTLVVLRRIYDLGVIDRQEFWHRYNTESERLRSLAENRGKGGGDFYRTQQSRLSERFARAVVISTLEGNTLYRDAFGLLGLRKQATFDELARKLGVV